VQRSWDSKCVLPHSAENRCFIRGAVGRYDEYMEAMTIHLISAVETEDGHLRARARVDSIRRHAGRPEMSMIVTLNLPLDDDSERAVPVPERAYDRLLAYLDIA